MKIKEVIEKTGLTDRAIRLYIENGLVTPENQKSYTGRNNYHFTQEDIDCLEQIAILRKADFSLEQIKTLLSGGEAARDVLLEYLSEKQKAVAIGQKIVEALKIFSEEETVTAEKVCSRIQESIENTPLPEADKKETKGERIEKWLMRIPSVIILVICSLLGIGVLLVYSKNFLFPQLYTNPMYYIGILYILIPLISAITVLLVYRKPLLLYTSKIKRKRFARLALAVALLIFIEPIGPVFLHMIPPIYSKTDDPENYLTLGIYTKMYSDDIYKLFPANIPRSAVSEDSDWYPPDKFLDTTKYYYYYQHAVDPSFHIFAEWILPEKEFIEELHRIRNYYPEGAKQQEQWGEWVCLSFTDDTLDFEQAKKENDYYYQIFAYNEKTGGLRYIISYSMDCGREEDPYFLELQWE